MVLGLTGSRRFPVTVTRLPVTPCQIRRRIVAYRPGSLSEVVTEHYRRACPTPKRSASGPGSQSHRPRHPPMPQGTLPAEGGLSVWAAQMTSVATERDRAMVRARARSRRSARVSPAFGARQTGAIFGPSGPLGFPATAKCSTAAATSATMRPEAANATSARSTTPPSSPATLRVPVTSRRPEFPCEGVFTALWGPAVALGSSRPVRACCARPAACTTPQCPRSTCAGSKTRRSGHSLAVGFYCLSSGRKHLLESRWSGPRDRPRSPRERGRRLRYRPVTVTTVRFGSAAICFGQNRSGRNCLLLNSLVWSAKCGDVGLDDSE